MTDPSPRDAFDRQAVSHAVRRGSSLAIAAVVFAGVVMVLSAPARPVAGRLLAFALAVIAVAVAVDVLVGRTRAADRTTFDRLARGAPGDVLQRPKGLKQAESTITFALRSGPGRDRWLRGAARVIVDDRLEYTSGVSVDSDPATVERLVGPTTWELIRPDRSPSEDWYEPGVPPAALRALLDDLERL